MRDFKGYPKIEEMVGKTFTKVYLDEYHTEMIFENDEERYVFFHDQDCCESVTIEDIVGDLSDLENTPLLKAEESNSADGCADETFRILSSEVICAESYTYTYYKFATIKGYVDVRWFGESNGYYSESVYLGREALNV